MGEEGKVLGQVAHWPPLWGQVGVGLAMGREQPGQGSEQAALAHPALAQQHGETPHPEADLEAQRTVEGVVDLHDSSSIRTR